MIDSYPDYFNDAMTFLESHEGGYVDDSRDEGGATNKGISLRFILESGITTIDNNHDGKIDKKDIESLSEAQIREIYRDCFWNKGGFERIKNKKLAIKIFDMSVNAGLEEGIRILQRTINQMYPRPQVVVDGVLGDATLQAINSKPSDYIENILLPMYRVDCWEFYEEIVKRDPTKKRFEKAWRERAYS